LLTGIRLYEQDLNVVFIAQCLAETDCERCAGIAAAGDDDAPLGAWLSACAGCS
jgi:uncharacterized membrane protein